MGTFKPKSDAVKKRPVSKFNMSAFGSEGPSENLGIKFAQKVVQNIQNKPLIVKNTTTKRTLVSGSSQRFKLLGFKDKARGPVAGEGFLAPEFPTIQDNIYSQSSL